MMVLRLLRNLPFDRREPGVWASGVAHAALLVAGLVAFTAAKLPESQEGIPVEVLTDSQVSEIPKGENAPEVRDRQERADRQAEQRVANLPGQAEKDVPTPPTRDQQTKVDDEEAMPPPTPPARPDIAKAEAEAAKAAAEAARAAAAAKAAAAEKAAATAKAAEAAKAQASKDAAKEAAKAEAARAEAIKTAQREAAEERAEAEREAAEAKQAAADARAKAEAKSRAEAKARADAEAKAALAKKLAEAEAREKAEQEAEAAKAAEQRRKVAEAKAQAEAKARADARAKADAEAKARRQAAVADRFNPGDISRLVGTETPQGSGSAGRQVQRTASLGAASGQSARLSPSERDQIVGIINEQLHRCWQVPVAADGADKPPDPVINVRIAPDGSLAGEPTVQNASNHRLFRLVADAAVRATRRCTPLRIPAKFAASYDVWKQLAVSYNVRE